MMTKLEWVLMTLLFAVVLAGIVILDRGAFCTVQQRLDLMEAAA